jgi:hypothetical protein
LEARQRERLPARNVLDSLRIAEGRARARFAASPDLPPDVYPVPGVSRIETDLARFTGAQYTWTFVHGFHADPDKPFGPHEDLHGTPTTIEPDENDMSADPEFTNRDSFPDDPYFHPGDHDGCTCDWEISLGED